MKEILPGVHHWTASHPKIGIEVSSYYLADEKVALDPILPKGGLEALPGVVEHIILTNRHHYRQTADIVRRFRSTVWASAPGMHEFTHGEKVRPFQFGDTLPGGLEAIEIGVLCPDETALFLPRAGGLLALADGAVRTNDGPLRFVEDELIGDDPPAVKKGLKRAYARLLDRPFDTLLLAHGWPIVGGGKEALRKFAKE